MSRALGLLLVAVGAWLSLGALSGCNAVLDIEEAQERTSGGTSKAGSTGLGSSGPTASNSCTDPVSSSCSDCVADNCSTNDQLTCKDSATCRSALLAYSDCLGSDCKETQQGDCFEPFGASVPTCFRTCAKACATSPVFSDCEVLCGCMETNCSGTFTSTTACMSECAMSYAKNPQVIRCRISHCEIAPFYQGESTVHCGHARGVGQCADSVKIAPAADCANKYLNSFACTDKTQCCSGNCAGHVCAPP